MKKRKNKPAKNNRGGTLAVRQPSATDVQAMMSPEYVKQRRDSIMELMRLVMIDGVHYGKIDGCGDKPALYQPGAQALCQLFNCGPRFEVVVKEEERGHRTVTVTCKLVNNATGAVVGEGRGVCTTLEKKYRWRQGGRVCPDCGAAAIKPSQFRPEFYCHNKVGGCGKVFPESDERITSQKPGRVENDDLADSYNTVEKIACKRAMVHATLNITGASELFTQDIEDMQRDDDAPAPRQQPQQEEAPKVRTVTNTAPAPQTDSVRKAAQVSDTPAPAAKPAPKTYGGKVLHPVKQPGEAAVRIVGVDLHSQSGPAEKRKWKLFTVVVEKDGKQAELGTFSGTLADKALEAKTNAVPALIAWSIDKQGRAQLDKCEPVAPAPKGPPSGRGRSLHSIVTAPTAAEVDEALRDSHPPAGGRFMDLE